MLSKSHSYSSVSDVFSYDGRIIRHEAPGTDTDVSVRLELVLSGSLIVNNGHIEHHRESELELCQFLCKIERGSSGWAGENIIPTLKLQSLTRNSLVW